MIYWQTINTASTNIRLRSLLVSEASILSGRLCVVTIKAKWLPVRLIPHQIWIPLVWFDMVNDTSTNKPAFTSTLST